MEEFIQRTRIWKVVNIPLPFQGASYRGIRDVISRFRKKRNYSILVLVFEYLGVRVISTGNEITVGSEQSYSSMGTVNLSWNVYRFRDSGSHRKVRRPIERGPENATFCTRFVIRDPLSSSSVICK